MNDSAVLSDTTCPSCGFRDSGRYCSNCGAELAPRKHGAFVHFVDSILKVSELKNYLIMFVSILASPTKRIIAYYEQGDARQAFQYLGYSATIWFLIGLSKVWIIKEHDLIVTLIYTLQFLISLSVSIPIFYKMSVGKSRYQRTLHEFLVISSLYVGTNIVVIAIATIVLMAIATYVQVIDFIIGSVVLLAIMVPIAIYTIRVLKYFWGLSIGRIVLNIIVSSFAGGAAGMLFLILTASIFNILPPDF